MRAAEPRACDWCLIARALVQMFVEEGILRETQADSATGSSNTARIWGCLRKSRRVREAASARYFKKRHFREIRTAE